MSATTLSCLVRAGRIADICNIITVKQSLSPVESRRGEGFILGSSPELYASWIKGATVKVLQLQRDHAAPIVGYAVCLPDTMVRHSELWQKKDRVAFDIPIDSIVQEKIAYFEQLAVLPRYRYYTMALLTATLDAIFSQGHLHLFATTVCEPFNNRATQGLFARAAAQTVGYLREHYTGYGTIVSQLHYLQRHDYRRARAKTTGCQLVKPQQSSS